MTKMHLLLINGPNLNLLGQREPEVYGDQDLAAIEAQLKKEAAAMAVELACFQSNHEGALIDRIHQAGAQESGIIINPGAYGHSSIALRDALIGVALPFIEVHLSNVAAREPFRHTSFISDVASGVIFGLGTDGYSLALRGLQRLLQQDAG